MGLSAVGWRHAWDLSARRRNGWLVRYHAVVGVVLLCVFVVLSLLDSGTRVSGGASAPRPDRVSTETKEPKDERKNDTLREPGYGFRSVILLTDKVPETVVAPILRKDTRIQGLKQAEPLSIPFFGAYWFFRAPAKGPGVDPHFHRGKPTELLLRSEGWVPLEMVARQNLGRHFDLTCCARIEVEITNADAFPGTVSLELRVLDTGVSLRPEISLGLAMVQSMPRWSPGGVGPPREMLRFRVPAQPTLRRFDELIVVFHRAPTRLTNSAKVSIERFVLMPH